MEEKAFFTEQRADSPTSLNSSLSLSFSFIILNENGSSTLLAFLSIIAGIISSPQPPWRLRLHGGSNSGAKLTTEEVRLCFKLSSKLSKSIIALFSLEIWNLIAKSSIFLANSSSENESKLALIALLKVLLFRVMMESGYCGKDRDL
ncbi:hypothetical protein P8452_25056 [Trifolium repens]|nr:hypothetical protein P8452_25056 [Trifolium repens]